MVKLAAAAASAAVLLFATAAAHAACNVPNPPAFSQKPSLGTMVSDQAKIEGGCVDGTPIGQNKPAAGNFTSLTVNGVPVGNQVLPTSCSGVPNGAAWNDGGTVRVCGASAALALLVDAGGGLVTDSGGGLVTP